MIHVTGYNLTHRLRENILVNEEKSCDFIILLDSEIKFIYTLIKFSVQMTDGRQKEDYEAL